MKKINLKSIIKSKSLILILFILTTTISTAFASDPPTIEILNKIGLPYDSIMRKISYSGIIEIENASASVLMSAAQEAIVLRAGTPHSQIVMNNTKNFKFIIKRSFEIIYKKRANNVYHDLIYVLKIETKSGKYRYTISNFELFNKEAKREVGKTGVNQFTGSTTQFIIGTDEIKTTPLEEILAQDLDGKNTEKFKNDVQQGVNDIIEYLNTYIANELSTNKNW